MRTLGWSPSVNMTSLLHVIDTSTSELDNKGKSSKEIQDRPSCLPKIPHKSAQCCEKQNIKPAGQHCIVDDVKFLAERFHDNSKFMNDKNGNKRTRRFLDSDNILLSVFEYESRRKRGITPPGDGECITSCESLRLPAIPSAANRLIRNLKSPQRITVSVPNQENGVFNKDSNDRPVRLQYRHRSSEECSQNVADSSKLISIIRTTPCDSIDVVYQANQPGDYLSFRNSSPTLLRVNPVSGLPVCDNHNKMLNIPEEKHEKNDSYPNNGKFPCKYYNSDRYMRSSSSDLNENWDGLDDPDTALIPVSQCQGESNMDRRSKNNKQRNEHLSTYDPDLHSKVYVRALRDARNKYFKHIPLNMTLTKPFEFSYFTFMNRNDSGYTAQEKRIKKPYGMKRIFGEVRQDDYYPMFIKK